MVVGQQLLWLGIGAFVCYGISAWGFPPRRVARIAALWILLLMLVQVPLVSFSGIRLSQVLLPLHLCSATALVTVPMLWRWDERLFQFCWYLGMPGALLALCVPVVGYSRFPEQMRAVFIAIHGALAWAPLMMRMQGVRPRRLAAWPVLLFGNLLLLLALWVNSLIGSNYMFLADPPTGTPLAFMASGGMLSYLAWLEATALILLRLLSRLTAKPQTSPSVSAPSEPSPSRRITQP